MVHAGNGAVLQSSAGPVTPARRGGVVNSGLQDGRVRVRVPDCPGVVAVPCRAYYAQLGYISANLSSTGMDTAHLGRRR